MLQQNWNKATERVQKEGPELKTAEAAGPAKQTPTTQKDWKFEILHSLLPPQTIWKDIYL